ncbi:molybdopterin cofactor-binding domain-containing protein [Pseudomonas juntendi]|uniref:molybdopterin cofactor-binding domain-containing protein n=1 Tax=Pseudomonas juntendi TaxID=2666183 RepID=UPI0034D6D983
MSSQDLMASSSTEGVSRRGFLRASVALGGGLLISISLPGALGTALAQDSSFTPNAYIRIEPSGKVVFVIQPVEMGQATYTSMPALIAEELEVGLDQIVVEHAPADDKRYANPALGFQVTGGSTSVPANWKPLREAGAAARMLLISAAANQWGWLRIVAKQKTDRCSIRPAAGSLAMESSPVLRRNCLFQIRCL